MTEVPRPLCKCHGELMIKCGKCRDGSIQWRCKFKAEESRRLYRERNPERCLALKRDGMRRAYEANPEKFRARSRAAVRAWEESGRCVRCGGVPNVGHRTCVVCIEKGLDYYHRADGGYIRQRRRTLASQRQETLERLAELQAMEAALAK